MSSTNVSFDSAGAFLFRRYKIRSSFLFISSISFLRFGPAGRRSNDGLLKAGFPNERPFERPKAGRSPKLFFWNPPSFPRKHSRQRTGLLPFGLNGTVQLALHLLQRALCNSLGPPKLLLRACAPPWELGPRRCPPGDFRWKFFINCFL